jgi:hypothetical protein
MGMRGEPPTPPVDTSPKPESAPEAVVDRPMAAQRVVAVFDFEEPAVYATPRYWRRLATNPAEEDAPAGPGFPSWNEPMLDLDQPEAFAGIGSVRLSTKGGSVGIRLDPGVVPVLPGAEYLVSARVRSDGLDSASPGIIARYLDRANRPVPGSELVVLASERSHRAVRGHAEPKAWSSLSLTLPMGPPEAAYIQLELVLLQPETKRAMGLADDASHRPSARAGQDLSGLARFDDVSIVQLPRVTLGVGAPGHCFVGPESPEVVLWVRDLAGEPLRCRVTLQDASGGIVDHVERIIRTGTAQERWRPNLPAGGELGWFRAAVDLYSSGDGQRVGSTYVDFCVLGALPSLGELASMQIVDRERFGIMLGSTDGPAGSIEALIDATGAGVAIIPAWDDALRIRDVPARLDALDALVSHVVGGRRGAWMSIARPPKELSSKVRAHGSLDDALALTESEWSPYLMPIVDRFGASVQRWVVGEPRREPDWSGATGERATRTLASNLPGAAILHVVPGESPASNAMASDMASDPRSGPAGTPMVYATPGLWPEGFGEMAQGLRGTTTAAAHAPGHGVAPALLLLAPDDRELAERGWREGAAWLARSMLSAWSAWSESDPLDAPALILQAPWRLDGPGTPRAMPTPLLATYRHVASQLAGRRAAGRIDLAPGVEGLILRPLDPTRTGAVVAWRTTADPDAALIEVDLGDGVIQVSDIFGNRRIARRGGEVVRLGPDARTGLAPARSSGDRDHRIWIPSEPIFIEGVDVPLARFVSLFRVEPGELSMFERSHQVRLIVENPWPVRIEGRLRVLEPGGLSSDGRRDRSWVITPRTLTFALAPGESASLPVQVSFSSAEEAGTKQVVADVELIADHAYEAFRVKAPIELGLESIDLALDARLVPDPIDGPDAEVRAQVTNRGKEPLSFEIVAWAGSYPRGKASASKVPPDGVVFRRFFFPGGASKLRGQRVTVGVEDVQTQARITRSVAVE